MTRKAPLEGLKILDLSTLIAAPMASGLLADFGADVVKIELPDGQDALRDLAPHKDGEALWWKVTNRNKRGITLDIRKDEGKELFRRLIPQFDVLVENFRPGTLERYGFDPETLHALNPHLIILRVTGYGQTGPLSQRPGFARVLEAFSGFTNLCGDADRAPLHIGYPVGDGVTGLFGAIGILVACYRRAHTPDAPGEVIDLSLFESLFRMIEFLPIEYDQLGVVRQRSGNRSQYAGPSNVYRTRDDRWFSMSASAQSVFERLARTIGRADLIEDPRFATNAARVQNAEALDAILQGWFIERTLDEILGILEANDVSGGPINTIADLAASPHVKARESIVQVDDPVLGPVAMPGVVPKFRDAPGEVRSPGPAKGQHTDSFFADALGLEPGEIERLHAAGVI
ncbi:CaiB/BaiF CoA transferase family protein [Futiania mangrovi]|uniref:CoA transferase n=1 Tax=Futiania mangrovi TaxID=2959716 RepID=A0A9J6PKQ5_9PROT|nr:CoA transferase [Futiania mangrovii]MCP1337167.1 CoA transferase [Futiania mangrovii]